MEVELAAREQQHVAHIGQVGVGGPRARFSSPRRSPRTMRRAQGYADQDKRQDQRTREDEGGEMCHAPLSAPGRGRANPGGSHCGQMSSPQLHAWTRWACNCSPWCWEADSAAERGRHKFWPPKAPHLLTAPSRQKRWVIVVQLQNPSWNAQKKLAGHELLWYPSATASRTIDVTNLDEYELWIDAYTPDSIPMNRLAEYLAAFSKLLGHQANVHFSRLEKGSIAHVAWVEHEASPKVSDRVSQTAAGTAANDALAAYADINKLLKFDNAIGELRARPAGGKTAVVIQFPGRNTQEPEKFIPFWEPAEVDGELVRIGGKDSSAHAQIVDGEGRTWSITLTRDLASRIAQFLYKGPVLRAIGTARWERAEDGEWKLLDFRVDDFEILDDVGLTEATVRLRALRDTDWSTQQDIDSTIARIRGHEDGLH